MVMSMHNAARDCLRERPPTAFTKNLPSSIVFYAFTKNLPPFKWIKRIENSYLTLSAILCLPHTDLQELLALFEGSKLNVSSVREVVKGRAVMLKMESAHKILIKSVLEWQWGLDLCEALCVVIWTKKSLTNQPID